MCLTSSRGRLEKLNLWGHWNVIAFYKMIKYLWSLRKEWIMQPRYFAWGNLSQVAVRNVDVTSSCRYFSIVIIALQRMRVTLDLAFFVNGISRLLITSKKFFIFWQFEYFHFVVAYGKLCSGYTQFLNNCHSFNVLNQFTMLVYVAH